MVIKLVSGDSLMTNSPPLYSFGKSSVLA